MADVGDTAWGAGPGAKVTDDPSQPEHRQSERQKFITFVWYKRVHADDTGPAEEGLARSCDISQGGVGLVTSRPVPEGARLFVEILSSVGAVSLVARVSHCHPDETGQYRIGLELEIVPPNDRQTLARILSP